MALTTQQIDGLGEVQFDSDLFDAEDLAGFADMAESLAAPDTNDIDEIDPADLFGAGSSFTPEEAQAEIQRQIETGEFMPDLFEEAKLELGRTPTAAEVVEGSSQIAHMSLNGTISPEVQNAVQNDNTVALVEIDGKYAVEVDGEVIFSLDSNGPLGVKAKVIAALVVVLIDLIFVVLAIINVVAKKNKKVADKVTKVTAKFGDKFLKLLGDMLKILKNVMSAVRDAKNAAGRRAAVKTSAKDIGKALYATLVYAYRNLWEEIKQVVGAFLSGAWQIMKVCASLAVSILSWIGTAGAILAASIINLALAVAELVVDSIKLKEAM
ncbi:MAG: hypothetical protein V7727_22215 [Sneathiella sp.]